MSTPAAQLRVPKNPFATRFTRPGLLPPLDVAGRPLDIPRLVASVAAAGSIAAIVGPHGHGKTTLLSAIARHARATGRVVTWAMVRGPADCWRTVRTVGGALPGDLICIDGWERMRFGTAWIARLLAAGRGCSLLVTAHAIGRLPVLHRCDSSPAVLAAIVSRVPDSGGYILSSDIVAAFERHDGNIREALYDLYDRFEDRVRRSVTVRI